LFCCLVPAYATSLWFRLITFRPWDVLETHCKDEHIKVITLFVQECGYDQRVNEPMSLLLPVPSCSWSRVWTSPVLWEEECCSSFSAGPRRIKWWDHGCEAALTKGFRAYRWLHQCIPNRWLRTCWGFPQQGRSFPGGYCFWKKSRFWRACR
jgi:hypothetical protein